MRVDRLDHLVLTVASIEATVRFYTQVLGMDVVTFGAGRTALTFGTSKINLHQAGQEFEPKALRPTPGSADICLITADGIAEVIAQLAAAGVPSNRARLNAPARPGPSSAATCAIRTTTSSNSATTRPDHPTGPRWNTPMTGPAAESMFSPAMPPYGPGVSACRYAGTQITRIVLVNALVSPGGCRARAPRALSCRSGQPRRRPGICSKTCPYVIFVRGLDDVQGLLAVTNWAAQDASHRPPACR